MHKQPFDRSYARWAEQLGLVSFHRHFHNRAGHTVGDAACTTACGKQSDGGALAARWIASSGQRRSIGIVVTFCCLIDCRDHCLTAVLDRAPLCSRCRASFCDDVVGTGSRSGGGVGSLCSLRDSAQVDWKYSENLVIELGARHQPRHQAPATISDPTTADISMPTLKG